MDIVKVKKEAEPFVISKIIFLTKCTQSSLCVNAGKLQYSVATTGLFSTANSLENTFGLSFCWREPVQINNDHPIKSGRKIW